MSEDPCDNGVVELTLRLRGLTITVSGPAQQASQFLSDISSLTSTSSRASEPSSTSSFSLVGSEHYTASQGRSRGETRQQILDSFENCPVYLLDSASRLEGGRELGEKRIRRAFLAGQWAGAVLAGRAGSPARTEQLALRPRVYVVLRAQGLASPVVLGSSAEYFRVVGDLHHSESISHSFPSETEVRAYCAGARVEYPGLRR